jgi:hypothetical protein
MVSSTFVNMFRRGIDKRLGLEQGKFTWARDYSYVEVAWTGRMWNPVTETETATARKGQSLRLIPETNITKWDGNEKLLVVVNPVLHQISHTAGMTLLEQVNGDTVNVPVTFRQDWDGTAPSLDYLIRIYTIS